MILSEAYDYMDLLLDKADEPYFVTEEKNKFLNLAISEFINMHYKKMAVDEDSRRALAGCIDWNSFHLTKAEIVSGDYINLGANKRPSFSRKYTDKGIPSDPTDLVNSTYTSVPTSRTGYFLYGHQFVLPKQHLYMLNVNIKTYNRDDIIDSTGNPYAGVLNYHVVVSEWKPVKNKSIRDYEQDAHGEDPFNKSDNENATFSYLENRMVITNSSNIYQIMMEAITLPTVEEAFSADTYQESPSPYTLVFAEHYQKQIIQMAVRKMSANVESSNYPQQQFESQV